MKLKKKVEAVDEAVVEEAEVVDAENEEDIKEGAEYPEQLNEDEKEALEATAPEDETGEGLDEIKYYEVYRKGNLILYEFEDANFDSVVSEEIVNEIFPEYETDSTKGYLIEENGEFYI